MDLDQRTGEDPQGRPVAAAAPLQDAGAGGAAQPAAASAPGAVLPAGSSGGQDEGDASRTLAPAAPLGAPEPAVRRGPWTDRREVTGWDGTFEEAVDADVIPRPPPLNWNRWQRWRSDEGGGPTIDTDGYSRDARHEATIYARVMRALYGPNYRDAARTFTLENPDWEPTPPLYPEPESAGRISSGAAAAGFTTSESRSSGCRCWFGWRGWYRWNRWNG